MGWWKIIARKKMLEEARQKIVSVIDQRKGSLEIDDEPKTDDDDAPQYKQKTSLT